MFNPLGTRCLLSEAREACVGCHSGWAVERFPPHHQSVCSGIAEGGTHIQFGP